MLHNNFDYLHLNPRAAEQSNLIYEVETNVNGQDFVVCTMYIHIGATEYMFLSGGKFMPGMEKLASKLFFSNKPTLVFTTVMGGKNRCSCRAKIYARHGKASK